MTAKFFLKIWLILEHHRGHVLIQLIPALSNLDLELSLSYF
jgi:hypothetical protein